MNEATELGSLAAKCRQLANAISDGPARNSLNDLAAEYDRRADESSEEIVPIEQTPEGWTQA